MISVSPELQVSAYDSVPSGSRDELLSLFADGFGDGYNHQFGQWILESATRIIELRHPLGVLAAAATIEGSRVTSGAVTSNRELGRRSSIGLKLLEACYDDGSAAWTSVSENRTDIQLGWRIAGMHRVNDLSVAKTLISETSNIDRDYVFDDEGGLTVVNGPEAMLPGLRQQIWAWDDRPKERPLAEMSHE